MYCEVKGDRKKLCEFVFTHNTAFTYKGKPNNIDGTYPLKYSYYDVEGYHFRPVINRRCLEIRYQDWKHPHPMLKNIVYIFTDKPSWERKCRILFQMSNYEILIRGYEKRFELPMKPSVFLNIEDEDEQELEEWGEDI